MPRLLALTALLLLLLPSLARAEFTCLTGIPGTRIIEFTGATWAASGRDQSESLCRSCQGAGDAQARATCIDTGIRNGWTNASGASVTSTQTRWVREIRTGLVREAIREAHPFDQNGAGYDPTETEIVTGETALYQACPALQWTQVQGTTSGGLDDYFRARDCGVRHLCARLQPGPRLNCERTLTYSSLGLDMVSVELHQSHAATEALRTGQSAPQQITFDDDTVVTAAPPPPRPPYRGEAGTARGITRQQLLGAARQAEARTGQQQDQYREATAARMGCPSNAEFHIENGSVTCIRTGYDGVPPVIARTMSDVSAATRHLVYRDLTQFAVRRVWESYTVALLMDPSIVNGCQSQAATLTRIRQQIGVDAVLGANTGYDEGLQRLTSCFGGNPNQYDRSINQLGMGSRVNDLATSARNLACGLHGDAQTGGDSQCAAQAGHDDGGQALRRHQEAFERRVRDLHTLDDRLTTLGRGRFRVEGREIGCPGYGRDCAAFFRHMEECAPDYRVSAGCLPPDVLTGDSALAWAAYRNLKDTENYIISHNPELGVEMMTVADDGHSSTTMPAWRAAYRGAIARHNPRAMGDYFETAMRQSRQKKLDLILNQACDDPEEFAKKMLLTNPQLVNDYMDQAASPDIGMLLCVGLSEAQADERSHAYWRMGATALTLAFGFAAAIPSGGSSLAFALGAISTAGAVGMTVYDVRAAAERLRLESGLHQGCIGDYNRTRQAEDALEDAVIRAAIDLGVGVGMFAGMTAIQKLAELRRMAAVAEGLEGAAPAWAAATENAARLNRSLQAAERELIADEYALAEVSGMTRSGGRLTRDGRRAADAIRELEEFGISRDAIQRALRSCVR